MSRSRMPCQISLLFDIMACSRGKRGGIMAYLLIPNNKYLDGELRMLAGGSADDSTITANLTGILYGLLRGGPCKVYNVDMQFQLSETRYVYPDVTVTCDPRDEAPEDSKTHYPTVVIEVLS